MASQEFIILNSKIKLLEDRIIALETKDSVLESTESADARETAIRSDLNAYASDLQDLIVKLSLINLPEETRYYLSAQEVNYLKKVIKEVQTLKAESERVLQAVISKSKYISTTG
ncbi:hypothetical protein [Acinetobacter sp.]|uniref:hypothetical protein n=1 Tax=Acinetobacter sp. TaxID=472 RepID=UPI003D001C2A